MHVIAHDGIAQDIDSIELCKVNQALLDPVSPMFIRFPAEFIDSTEHRSTHSTIYTVHNRNFIGVKDFTAILPSHLRFSEQRSAKLSKLNKDVKLDGWPQNLVLSDAFEVAIASPEDSIVAKLEWFRIGNETSERQWNDVSKLIQLLGEHADWEYLKRASKSVGVADLLEQLAQ